MTTVTTPQRSPVSTPPDLGLPPEPPKVRSDDPPVAHIRVKLDRQLRAVLEHEPGTRAGTEPEHLHQMRVAIRRMRSVLKVSGGLGPTTDEVRAELGWLGNALGEVRDYDVLIEHLREVVAEFETTDQLAARQLVARFVAQRGKAKRRLTKVLNGGRYRTTLTMTAQLARPGEVEPVVESQVDATTEVDLVRALRKPYRKLAKAVAALPENPPDDDLHALRIHGKRLRYAGELAKPAAPDKAAKKAIKVLVKAAERLQTVLGDHQDAVVAADRVRALAADADPAIAFIAGRIVEREHLRCAVARAVWPEVVAEIDAAAEVLLSR
ncbi:CHAD domain-containing protein [Amycolatopsis magusensis]|uniref:CHAD domain-containing protein n=1 Tax=Amycolatopsis magusensis TaxID=882444 RepID=UPI0024A973B9|nr:CHAD domain-containing protein [Amycolatopsis magusensis]MDI5977425.1 CHAD domain-containing protein [Amycolatopsis magusensis]